MTELERLLHNLVSAIANVATARSMLASKAEKERDAAVAELAAYLEPKRKP